MQPDDGPNRRVPRPVMEALGIAAPVQTTSLTGSWGERRAVRVSNTTMDVVLKCWVDSREQAKGRAETKLLARLESRAFPHAPQPVRLGRDFVYRHGSDLWTAQEYIAGTSPRRDAFRNHAFTGRLGAAIGALHRDAPSTDDNANSRLNELETMVGLAIEVAPVFAPLVEEACGFALSRLDDVLALPRATLHGDCNLENIVETPGRLALIDFEFTRNDVRLLDLASLAAPLRDSHGTLRLAPSTFQRLVTRAYAQEVVSLSPLGDHELRLLPVVSLMHFLLVVHDQLKARSHHLDRVVPIIHPLLRRARR